MNITAIRRALLTIAYEVVEQRCSLLQCMSLLRAQAVWKFKKSKRDENDILGFGLKLESACVWAPKRPWTNNLFYRDRASAPFHTA